MRGQVLHLGVLHGEEPGLSTVFENFALVNNFFRFGGCLLLLRSLNVSLMAVILVPVPVFRRSLVLGKTLGLLGLWVDMKGRIFFGREGSVGSGSGV